MCFLSLLQYHFISVCLKLKINGKTHVSALPFFFSFFNGLSKGLV